MLAHVLARQFNEIAADDITNATTAGMQHQPYILLFIQAQFNEMITATERAELSCPGSIGIALHFQQARMLLDNPLQATGQGPQGRGRRAVSFTVHVKAYRHCCFNHLAQGAQVIGQVPGTQAEAGGNHSTANINPDCRRNDGAFGRNDGADRSADANMDIGHCRDMVMNDRQTRDMAQLCQSLRVDIVGVDLDRQTVRRLDDALNRHGEISLARGGRLPRKKPRLTVVSRGFGASARTRTRKTTAAFRERREGFSAWVHIR